jgi:hypothetical protein
MVAGAQGTVWATSAFGGAAVFAAFWLAAWQPQVKTMAVKAKSTVIKTPPLLFLMPFLSNLLF